MNSARPQRLLLAGALVSVLTACGGGGSQLPPAQTPQLQPQSAQAPVQPQVAQRSTLFADTLQPSTSTRSVMSVSPHPCIPVVTSRGPLTAAVVPTHPIEGANIDASGCDVGVYLGPTSNRQIIVASKVHDANQIGIFADQAQNAVIAFSKIYKIGNHDTAGAFAPNGVQTGIGLYFRGASGWVEGADIYQYQKNGTAFNCLWNADFSVCLKPSRVSMRHSRTTGLGQVNYIAQNGIQYWDSTAPQFEDNVSRDNMYLNPADLIWNKSATGYLFLCTNIKTEKQLRDQENAAYHNDINYDVTQDPTQC